MSNAVTVLGINPIVADIADCLICAATLPGEWPFATIEVPDAVYRYRVCDVCLQRYFASSNDDVARWRNAFCNRLTLVSEKMLHNAQAMIASPQETVQ